MNYLNIIATLIVTDIFYWGIAVLTTTASHSAAAHSATASAVSIAFSATGTTHTASAHSTKEIQLIDEMYHEVAIDAIGPGIASHLGIDGTADIALLMKNIVELYA